MYQFYVVNKSRDKKGQILRQQLQKLKENLERNDKPYYSEFSKQLVLTAQDETKSAKERCKEIEQFLTDTLLIIMKHKYLNERSAKNHSEVIKKSLKCAKS